MHGKSLSELKTYANRVDGFSVLGDAFMKDEWNINNGYPILIWEVPDWQFTEKNTCIAIGETIDIDIIDIGRNMLHKNQGGFTWTSSDPNIAKVDNNGRVTGVSAGEITISATNGGITLETKVRVIETKLANTDTKTYIYTAKDLAKLRDSVNAGNTYAGKTVQLMADIDLSTICGYKIGSWKPIGTSTVYYSGIFNGNNHTISNIYIYSDSNYQGLFGRINEAEIKNVILGDGAIKAKDWVAGISGWTGNSTIYGCINNVNVTTAEQKGRYTGGIIGIASLGTNVVEMCANNGNISGSYSVAGIVGNLSNTVDIKNSYNTGTINCNGDNPSGYSAWSVGGIAGYTNGSSSVNITNCYNTGTIGGKGSSTNNYVGGIVGLSASTITISNCYSIGTLKNGKYIGGITYRNATLTNCYYLSGCGATTGGTSVAENTLKGYAETLGDAYMPDTTPNINNGYPILEWQITENR